MSRGGVRIDLACNDPQNGEPSGQCLQLSVIAQNDTALELWTVEMDRGPTCRIDDAHGRLRLGQFQFNLLAHSRWTGNWCWDSVYVTYEVAASLLNKTRASGWWTPDSGWSTFVEQWEAGEMFTADGLARELSLGSAAPA